MAVGVVVGETLIKPDDLARAEGVDGAPLRPACSLQPLRFALSRVWRVARIVPPAVMIDGAPFEHEVEVLGLDARERCHFAARRSASSGKSNLPPQPFFRNRQRDRPILVPREDRAGVA